MAPWGAVSSGFAADLQARSWPCEAPALSQQVRAAPRACGPVLAAPVPLPPERLERGELGPEIWERRKVLGDPRRGPARDQGARAGAPRRVPPPALPVPLVPHAPRPE